MKNERLGTLPAAVPGCVHTDLIKNEKITDIFWRDNNKRYGWLEDEDWDYECSFTADQGENVSLVFEDNCFSMLEGEIRCVKAKKDIPWDDLRINVYTL